jgi:hypothetical protein
MDDLEHQSNCGTLHRGRSRRGDRLERESVGEFTRMIEIRNANTAR